MDTETESFKLIITIVNRGFSEKVMDSARANGAKGGTVLHGRGTSADSHNIFGISIDPEKDIVLIVTKKDCCVAIMEAVDEAVGLKTPGSGICFVLPVDRAVGIADDCKAGE